MMRRVGRPAATGTGRAPPDGPPPIGRAGRWSPTDRNTLPGPVCYGRGGTRVTLTDANLLLGYLNENHPLGGKLRTGEVPAKPSSHRFSHGNRPCHVLAMGRPLGVASSPQV